MTQDTNKFDFIRLLSKLTNPISDEDTRRIALSEMVDGTFPTKKNELWKHTDIRPILKHGYSLPETYSIDRQYIDNLTIHGLNSLKLVFMNGMFINEKSQTQESENLIVIPIQEAKAKYPDLIQKYLNKGETTENNLFTNLNTAFAESGFFIYIPENKKVLQPIHIMNFNFGNNQKIITQTHNLIIADTSSELKIISSYHSLSKDYTLSNVITEIFCKENSDVEYYMFQGEGNDAFHVHDTRVTQETKSKFSSNTSTLCGAIVRNNLNINLQGEHCETELTGLYMPEKEQHFDNYVFVNHAKPHCKSSQVYRGVIDNKAEAVFLGKVYVAKNAQKTDAKQSNKNILLTPYAKAHSKPQLEIYADDVDCAHGSTTGQIDKESLFYLRSRGIGERQAITLLLGAYSNAALENIKLQPYKDFVNFLINKRLHGEEVTGLCDIKICPSC